MIDIGDRLAIWSPVNGGALLYPKGPGLRAFGLIGSEIRGAKYYLEAFTKANIRKGRRVRLKREPDNPHDPKAVAIYVAELPNKIGHVQRGRAPAVARHLDAGEPWAGVVLRGPAPDHNTPWASYVLIGDQIDLDVLCSDLYG